MKTELSRERLRLFSSVFFLICIAFTANVKAYASESIIRIYADSGTIRREITGEGLFKRNLMPGDSEQAELTIENKLDKPIYYEIKSTSAVSNNLYNALQLNVTDIKGENIYKGDLKNFNVRIGPQKSRQDKKIILTLSLPREADSSTAGNKTDFSLEVLLKSEADSGSSKDDSGGGSGSGNNSGSGGGSGHGSTSGSGGSLGHGSTSGSGGTGGTGRGSVDVWSGSTKGNATTVNGSVSETGNIISGSAYDRRFNIDRDGKLSDIASDQATALKRTGFITNSNVSSITGGGEFRTYKTIDPKLKKGIDYGSWKKDKNGLWKYTGSDGICLKNGFAFIKGPQSCSCKNIKAAGDNSDKYYWYFFDEKGYLLIGWIKADDNVWYHSHEIDDVLLGAVESGWIYGSEDKALYYTSEIDATMKSGWWGFKSEDKKEIEYYYFARLSDTYRQNWFFNTGIGRWIYDRLGYRSYGSMYRAETTPDGYKVAKDGRWTE